jgi:hypothetical protein
LLWQKESKELFAGFEDEKLENLTKD